MRVKELLRTGDRLKHYAGVAAGSLGLAGGRAVTGPIHAQIGICDPCNHRCVFCWDHPPVDYQSEATRERFGHEKPGTMSLETFCGIVDDLYEMGTRRVDMVGRGEPLINESALDMVRYAKQRDMHVVLCTNASKLSTDLASDLVTAGLDRLNVSLNAGSPKTYPSNHTTETPEDFLQVKENLHSLAKCRETAASAVPLTRLSFVISARNHFEIERMVRLAREVGAHEVRFEHVVVHDGTKDIALDEDQYKDLLAALPAARCAADELGVETNLATFAAFVPTYLSNELLGPRVVPCYVGYYFSVVLGNGSVMPCCQCAEPIARVESGRCFADIWRSPGYGSFREAAKGLPEPSEWLAGCECDRCMLRPRNISIHNVLHPWNRMEGGEDAQLFSFGDLMRLRKVDRR